MVYIGGRWCRDLAIIIILAIIIFAWFGVEILPGYGNMSGRVNRWRVPLQCTLGVGIGLVVGSPIIVAFKYGVYKPLGILIILILCLSLLGIYVVVAKITKRIRKCGG